VEWNLILFLAATLVMGEALLASGAAQWLADGAAAALPQAVVAHPTSIALAVAVLAMLSHLVITSRSARATVLIPTLALPLAIAPEQAIGLIVLVTMASGFCQTFKVSAKPVALFATDERNGIADADLLRLSLALMPSFLLALAACAFGLWPAAGLSTDLGVYPLAQLPSE
jgi:di/tricarboxylate transporter